MPFKNLTERQRYQTTYKRSEASKKRQILLKKEWRNKQNAKGMCRECTEPHLPNHSMCAKHRTRVIAIRERRNRKLKDTAYNAYGGYTCACCGTTEEAFLTLDHVHNDGAIHRRKSGIMGAGIYYWLAKQKYPPGFQVLCLNCNIGRHRNGGVCPHQTILRGPPPLKETAHAAN